ncbi:hypothetical protein Agub_g15284, partial [Astrephomene gubernaculifera]
SIHQLPDLSVTGEGSEQPPRQSTSGRALVPTFPRGSSFGALAPSDTPSPPAAPPASSALNTSPPPLTPTPVCSSVIPSRIAHHSSPGFQFEDSATPATTAPRSAAAAATTTPTRQARRSSVCTPSGNSPGLPNNLGTPGCSNLMASTEPHSSGSNLRRTPSLMHGMSMGDGRCSQQNQQQQQHQQQHQPLAVSSPSRASSSCLPLSGPLPQPLFLAQPPQPHPLSPRNAHNSQLHQLGQEYDRSATAISATATIITAASGGPGGSPVHQQQHHHHQPHQHQQQVPSRGTALSGGPSGLLRSSRFGNTATGMAGGGGVSSRRLSMLVTDMP